MIRLNAVGNLPNVVSKEFIDDFNQVLKEVADDPHIEACAMISSKDDHFIRGTHLKQLLGIHQEQEVESLYFSYQSLLKGIEGSPKPIVAAMHGATTGIGLEVALACHYRIATGHPQTVFSFPEVAIGLVPTGVGLDRILRLIELREALLLLLTGRTVRTSKALQMGLIDQIEPVDKLTERAIQVATHLNEKKVHSPRNLQRIKRNLILNSLRLPIVGKMFFKQVRQQIQRKTRGHYPAPLEILETLETRINHGQVPGYVQGKTSFKKLISSAETKNLIWLSDTMQELSKPSQGKVTSSVKGLLVLGGGLMGEGIASVSLPLNPVTVRDIQPKTLKRLEQSIFRNLEKRKQTGSLTTEDEQKQRSRLETVSNLGEISAIKLKEIDLVIEAVFEDLKLKQKVLAETEELISPKTVFATNTSALPIHQIAANALHADRVLGMHYFSPVHKMPLLEIIVTSKTADWAAEKAIHYGMAQGKSVIVVKDSPGFYTTRILAPFLNESILLLEQGAKVEKIDQTVQTFGYPIGPMTLLDEVGIDVGAHVSQDLAQAFKERDLKTSDFLSRMAKAGFVGRKNRRGFYQYPPPGKKRKGRKEVNSEVYEFLKKKSEKATIPTEDIQDRIVLMMVNEAALCLEAGIIRSPKEGDIGAVLGLGFAPFRGGPFHYVDSLGASNIVARLEALSSKYGSRFTPAEILRKQAKDQQRFFRN